MTVAEVRRIRRVLYSLYLLGATISLVLWSLGVLSATQVRLVLGYGTLTALDIVGVRFLRKNVDIYPIYSVEKGFAGLSFMLIMMLGVAGYTQVYPALAWIWIGILYGSKVLALEFILKKGVVTRRAYVQTEHGAEEVPPPEVMDRWADTVAGWLRHGYVSTPRREVVKEGLGIPANDAWTRDLLAEHRARRERAQMDGVEALQLEDHGG